MVATRKYYLLMLPVLIACAFFIVTAQQPAAGPYTAAQAAAGRATYQERCASCHLEDLGGRFEAPQLAGSDFMTKWGERTTAELISFMKLTMPPANPGSLDEQAYIGIAAFLLDANGARAGAQPLTAASGVGIRSVATGQVPATIRPAPGTDGHSRQRATRGAQTSGSRASKLENRPRSPRAGLPSPEK